jgi:hypothetical protein
LGLDETCLLAYQTRTPVPAKGFMMLAAHLSGRIDTTSRLGARRRARGPAPEIVRASGVMAALALLGCSTPPQDDLAAEIRQYYARHASEEDGRCASPKIASVTERKVLASGGEEATLRVRYSYFDESAQPTDWTRVLQLERACTGFAERDFTLVRGPLGYQVVEMSGPARAP